MEAKEFIEIYKHPNIEILETKLTNKAGPVPDTNDREGKIFLKGMSGSSVSLFAAKLLKKIKLPQLFILKDRESAAYFFNDLNKLLDPKSLYFLPSSFKRSLLLQKPDSGNILLRTEIQNILASTKRRICLVTYPEAIIEKVLSRNELKKNSFQLKSGEQLSVSFMQELFEEYSFELVDFVYEPGQYSIRGSIVDVFSFSNDMPYRIDFFGDEVESIRSFDPETQLSTDKISKISILPDTTKLENSHSLPFFNIIDRSSIVWTEDLPQCLHTIEKLFTDPSNTMPFDEKGEVLPEAMQEQEIRKDIFIDKETFTAEIKKSGIIEFGDRPYFDNTETLEFNSSPQPSFNKNFELLVDTLLLNRQQGYTNYILSDSEKQSERLKTIFSDLNKEVGFIAVKTDLHEGFTDHDQKICCYTDHQIFERYHKYRLKQNFSKKHVLSLKELTGLMPGDYVVHIDHGIGRFGGLEKIEINGKVQESVKLVYKDNDTLYVSIHSLHRIAKYKGRDLDPPKIYKLGSGAWQKLKQKASKKIKDIAKELISLYAKRRDSNGFSYSADSYLQQELEASFIYEDTPDQLETTRAIKKGMEALYPMDRLVCGDVGFGKTEIAIRTAFKAICDSKQVVVLVPTTILALQHYNTFRSRLRNFPGRVEYLSRFVSAARQRTIIEDLAKGRVDIIIGTHRLVSKDIKFKDLGLLIIDEEQKFGVSVKEKIRKLKANIDTLTLTATPIPRTLQFSMLGVRDMSVMRTPPPNRHPIITELHTFNTEIIREGIEFELSRGGQVFFIHNRLDSILEIQKTIEALIPKVSTAIAHGKMEGKLLESTMLNFIKGEFDVLIATTIIESGLDIPNANTIFINNAQNFGLSDLHQLRGRVGRSNKKAFCYLMAPPLQNLSSEAKRRLSAIEEFSELGSGFNIALQDLDIRGAGNLLGAEQSGFIAEIGLETFQRILDEAVIELKEAGFYEQLEKKEVDETETLIEFPEEFVNDVHIETDLELLFPEDYIENTAERIRLYKKLDDIDDPDDLKLFKNALADRFGIIPPQAMGLMNVVSLRKLAKELGFEKIILKNNILISHFISNPESVFYKSPVFGSLINAIQKKPDYRIREKNSKLILSIKNIEGILAATGVLEDLKRSL